MQRYLPILVVIALQVFIISLLSPIWLPYLKMLPLQAIFCGLVTLSGLLSLKIAKVGTKQRQKNGVNHHMRRGCLERMTFAMAGFALLSLGTGFGVYLTFFT